MNALFLMGPSKLTRAILVKFWAVQENTNVIAKNANGTFFSCSVPWSLHLHFAIYFGGPFKLATGLSTNNFRHTQRILSVKQKNSTNLLFL